MLWMYLIVILCLLRGYIIFFFLFVIMRIFFLVIDDISKIRKNVRKRKDFFKYFIYYGLSLFGIVMFFFL